MYLKCVYVQTPVSSMFQLQFAVLLMVIFVIELAVGIAASIAKEEFANAMRATLKLSMGNYTQTSTDQAAWDSMQRKVAYIMYTLVAEEFDKIN